MNKCVLLFPNFVSSDVAIGAMRREITARVAERTKVEVKMGDVVFTPKSSCAVFEDGTEMLITAMQFEMELPPSTVNANFVFAYGHDVMRPMVKEFEDVVLEASSKVYAWAMERGGGLNLFRSGARGAVVDAIAWAMLFVECPNLELIADDYHALTEIRGLGQ